MCKTYKLIQSTYIKIEYKKLPDHIFECPQKLPSQQPAIYAERYKTFKEIEESLFIISVHISDLWYAPERTYYTTSTSWYKLSGSVIKATNSN